MTKNISKTKHVDDLRKQAEKRIPKPADSIGETSEIEVKKLIHELEVHQIELEMQNEALRKSQMETAESHSKYTVLYDFAPIGYFTFDRRGHIIEANVTGAFLLGAEKRSLANQPFQRFIAHEHLSIFQSHLQKAHELRSKQTCKLKLTGKDGSLFDALIDTIVVIDGEGKFDHYRSAVTDITEITRAEAALREVEEGYRTLASTVDSMYFVDRECRYQFMNDAHLLRLGVSLEQVKGRSYGDFHSEEDLKQFAATIEAVFETGNSFQTEHKGRIGDSFFLRTFSAVKNSQGSITAVTVISKDITERKRAEESLRESEEKYRALVETTDTGFVIIDENGTVLDANENYIRMTGHKALDEIRNRSITEWTSRHDLERNEQAVRECFDQGFIRDLEISYVNKKGENTPVDINASVVETKEGRKIVFSLCRDITERKRAEERLHESEARYRMLFDNAADGIALADIETGRLMDCNQGLCRMVERNKAELVGQAQSVIHPPEAVIEGFSQTFQQHQTTDPGTALEDRLLSKSGKLIPVEIRAARIKINGRDFLVGIFRDITERKRAEEALRQGEERFRAIANYTYDWENWVGSDGKLLWVNPGVFRFTGYSVNECLSMSDFPLPLIDELDREKVAQHFTAAVQGASANDVEFRICRKDGSLRWAAVSYQPIYDSNGASMGYRSGVRDITERKWAEEAIKASHQQLRILAGRLQSVREEQRKQIAREIHDELGGALTGLKIDLSFLASSASKGRDKTKRDFFLSKILDMTKLIDETIGTVRRVVTELRPSILDDFGLLEALEWQLEEFKNRKRIQCKLVSTMAYVSLDEERSIAVFRIFQESLTNVARHANATKVTVTLYKEANSLVLKVEDNGKGISEDDIHNVKSIGLIGMRERASFLRGTVNFSGEPSKGTIVSLQFPFES